VTVSRPPKPEDQQIKKEVKHLDKVDFTPPQPINETQEVVPEEPTASMNATPTAKPVLQPPEFKQPSKVNSTLEEPVTEEQQQEPIPSPEAPA